MDEFVARLECLRLAVQNHHGSNHRDIVESARRYYDFLAGTRDAEIVDAARVFVEKVR